MVVVQKFGGSSVADLERLKNVANIVKNTSKENKVVVVVSAQGKTTDELVKKYMQLGDNLSNREKDVVLATGEQITIGLLSMLLEKMGNKVISYTGWQVPIITDSEFGNAKIKKIYTDEINKKLEEGYIVIVAGFQGIDINGNITTLGRGGSDTTAVALGAALNADKCEIYTDVNGVLTADPRLIELTEKLDEISYDEMIELASSGAKVLQDRCIKIAKEHEIEIEVKSSFENSEGTVVKDETDDISIKGISKLDNISQITIVGNNVKEKLSDIFELLKNIKIYSVNLSEIRLDIFIDTKYVEEITKKLHDNICI